MENRFNNYSSTELAGEDRFVRWVLHGEDHHEWNRWTEEHPGIQPRIQEAKKLVLALHANTTPGLDVESKTVLWNKIQSSIQNNTQKAPVRESKNKITVLWKWGLAAAAALTLVVWINSLTAKETIYAQAGEQKEITLPEGSSVVLNAGSVLSYKQSSFDEERMLQLEGEAFFKVKPGSTFTVNTKEGNVTVLGTSFNVFTRGDRFEVSCYTGKIKVSADDQTEMITAGQKTIKKGSSISASTFSPTGETPGWTTGKFSFDNQLLEYVFDELERQYNVRVDLAPGIETMAYTGFFESGDLDEALELITWPLHLHVVKKGTTITISR